MRADGQGADFVVNTVTDTMHLMREELSLLRRGVLPPCCVNIKRLHCPFLVVHPRSRLYSLCPGTTHSDVGIPRCDMPVTYLFFLVICRYHIPTGRRELTLFDQA